MLIFLVARTNPQSDGEAFYDACHAYVCIAKDEQAARELGGHSHNDEREEVWLDKERSTVTRRGTADDEQEDIVIFDVCNG